MKTMKNNAERRDAHHWISDRRRWSQELNHPDAIKHRETDAARRDVDRSFRIKPRTS